MLDYASLRTVAGIGDTRPRLTDRDALCRREGTANGPLVQGIVYLAAGVHHRGQLTHDWTRAGGVDHAGSLLTIRARGPADALGQISRRLTTAPNYCFGNFSSRLISRICRMCRCSCVEVSSAHWYTSEFCTSTIR